MSKLKITLTVLISLLGIASALIALLLLAPMTYVGLIERALQSTTGLAADINELEVDLFPPRVTANDLRVSNPRLDSSEALLTLENFSATISPNDWWEDAPTWWSAAVSGIVIRAARDAAGRSNWDSNVANQQVEGLDDDAPADDDAQGQDTGPLFSFSEINITDLDFVRVIDGESHQLAVAELVLGKDQDERLNIKLDARYRDQPLIAKGTLALPRSDQAREVDFQASLFGNEIRMLGRVGHDGLFPGEAHFSAHLKDLSTLSQLLDQNLDSFSPVVIDGMLNAPLQGRWELSAQGNLGINKFDVASAANVDGDTVELENLMLDFGASSLAASGKLDSAAKFAKLEFDAERLNVDQLLSYSAASDEKEEDPPESASLNPGWLAAWTIAIDATATRIDYQPYRLQNLAISVDDRGGELHTKGSLGGLSVMAENAGKDASSKENAAQEVSDNDENATENRTATSSDDSTAWQLVKPLKFEAALTLARKTGVGDWPLTARVTTKGANVELDTALPARGDADLDGEISATIDNLAFVEGIETDRWDSFLPFTLSAQARKMQSKLSFKLINFGISGNDVNGELSIDRAHEPIQIDGALNSKLLDLNQFATTTAENVEDAGEVIDKDSGDVIGDEPIDWSWLDAAQIDLSATLDKFNFNQANMRNVQTEIKLQNGELTIDPLKADLSKGGIRGDINVKRKDEGALLDGSLIATGLSPADLGRENAGLIDGGNTDVLIKLQTGGVSPQQLAAALNGEIAFEVQRATIRNSLFEIIGSDILTETFSLINPFAKEDDRTELECAAIYFKAEDGVLTSPDQLVIETNKIKIRGGGEVDLGEETLMIDFVPTARQGLGISLSSLSSVVRLGGTLGSPQPVADPKGIFKAGATVGAAVATGGLSLLGQGLFDRVRSAGTACGKIFEQVPSTDIPQAIDRSAAADVNQE